MGYNHNNIILEESKEKRNKRKYKNEIVKYDEIQRLRIELSEKDKQIREQIEEI